MLMLLEDLPQACVPDSVKRLIEVCEVVEQIVLIIVGASPC